MSEEAHVKRFRGFQDGCFVGEFPDVWDCVVYPRMIEDVSLNLDCCWSKSCQSVGM